MVRRINPNCCFGINIIYMSKKDNMSAPTKPVIAEYIWLGGNNELRSKTKIFYLEKKMSYYYNHLTILDK